MSTITQEPDPAAAGSKVKFCISLDGVSLPVTLNGSWDPGGQTFSHTVTSDSDRCFTVEAPSDAEGGIITDDSGQVEDFAIFVS